MPSIFLLEDSLPTATAITTIVEKRLELGVVWATSLQEASTMLQEFKMDYVAAVVDLALPDATVFEALELVQKQGLPAIVFTCNMDEELRKSIWKHGIVDYVLKDRERSMEYLVSMLGRLHRNPDLKVLVVDDSSIMRDHYGELLCKHRYQVLQAESGEQALEVLKDNPDIKLALVDYIMPGMDGIELTEHIRHTHSKEDLSIIALSGQDKEEISAQFIKSGANDYIDKRMSLEGFYCRISHQVEMLENIQLLRESGHRDFLTGAHNRRYFFEAGEAMLAAASRGGRNVALAMLDIDHFKRVNDTFGHDVGDQVIRDLARILRERFRQSDLVARFGGEEFCVLLSDVPAHETESIFESLRKDIQKSPSASIHGEVPYTVSIGVCSTRHDSLESMISHADALLYQAKNGGRNRVECSA